MFLLGGIILYQTYRAVSGKHHPRIKFFKSSLGFLAILLLAHFILGLSLDSSLSKSAFEISPDFSGIAMVFQVFVLVFACVATLLFRIFHGKLLCMHGSDWSLWSPLIFVVLLLAVNLAGAVFTRSMVFRENRRIRTDLEHSRESLEKLVQQRMLFASTSSSLMSSTPALVNYLDNPGEESFSVLEHVLQKFAENFPDGICYVMNKEGLVLASSGKRELFVGRFLNFRSYFKDAMNGKNGILIDYGKFTNELGFYSSHPVIRPSDNKIVGVCAVKRNMNDLIEVLNLYRKSILVDSKNKVFLASDPGFVGKVVVFEESDDLSMNDSGYFIRDEQVVVSGRKSFFSKFSLNAGGWQIIILASSAPLTSVKIWSFSFFLVFSLVFIAFFIGNEKKEALMLARKSAESRFESVLFTAPEGILIISSQDQKILLANQGFERMFALTKNPTGKFYHDFIPGQRTSFQKVVHFPEDGSFLNEREFIRSDDSRFFAEIKGTATVFDGQKAIILFLRDISRRIADEKRLKQAKVEAETASLVKSRFLAHTSHEVRTPLTAIIGLNEMARKLCGSDEQKKLLDLASATSRSLLELLNDILDLSQLEADKFEVVMEPFDLRQLLGQVLQIAGIRNEDELTNSELDFDERIPRFIVSDGRKLRQVLTNLVILPRRQDVGGRISLESRLLAKDAAKLELQILIKTGECGDEELAGSVSHQVQGMNDAQLEEYLAEDVDLRICRKIMSRLGGRLSVKHDSENHFCWVIDFKATAAESGQKSDAESDETECRLLLCRDSVPLRILVADDNETNLFLASSIISEYKGIADCAHDGNEALKLAGEKIFDLALLDIMMPNLDGLETIHCLRKLENANATIPIIALSAFSTEEEKEKAIQAGANHYLAKPYFPNDLLAAIKKVLGNGLDRTADENPADGSSAALDDQPALRQVNLKELEIRILQKPENIRQVNEIFSKRSKVLSEALLDCVASKDSQRLREVAHSVKGLAGMLAAQKVFSLAFEIEQLAKDNKFSAAVEKVPLLQQQIGEIAQDLISICKRLQEG